MVHAGRRLAAETADDERREHAAELGFEIVVASQPRCTSYNCAAPGSCRTRTVVLARKLALEDEVNQQRMKWVLLTLALCGLLTLGACKKKVQPAPAPPPPPPPAPTASLTANPSTIEK